MITIRDKYFLTGNQIMILMRNRLGFDTTQIGNRPGVRSDSSFRSIHPKPTFPDIGLFVLPSHADINASIAPWCQQGAKGQMPCSRHTRFPEQRLK